MNDNIENIKFNLGKRIKELRIKSSLTQEECGKKIGISQHQITLVESGKSFPKIQTLIKLSTIFNCNMYDFFLTNEDLEKNKLFKIINNYPPYKLEYLQEQVELCDKYL